MQLRLLFLSLSVVGARAATAGVDHGGEGAVHALRTLRSLRGGYVTNTAILATPNRSEKLLYNHMPKAGGTFLKKVFFDAVGTDDFVLQPEFRPLLDTDVTPKTFTVGSVRNPCEYYVSLWAFGSDGKGSFQGRVKRYPDGKFLYASTDHKDTNEDVRRFQSWVRAIVAGSADGAHLAPKPRPGLETARFALSYGRENYMNDERVQFRISRPPRDFKEEDQKVINRALAKFDTSSVDCWVKTEDMEAGARRCLGMFERQGGKVDWRKFKDSVASMSHNPSVHMPCRSYFDAATEKLVRLLEHDIFEMFDYDQCCAD